MNTHKITDIRAESIPDSRGNPTLSVTVVAGSASGTFSVPSGASTGTKEACELRDKDRGMRTAIAGLTSEIRPALIGMDVEDQPALDAKMIALDGTEFKSRLGGNTLIGVSVAAAKAAAAAQGTEIFRYLRTLAEIQPSRRVPLLYLNYINGGKHAHSPLSFQEHMMVPDTESITESLAMAEKIGAVLENLILEKYGPEASHALGDEGGYVIQEKNLEVPFELLETAIGTAGYAGRAHIAADVAASSFYKDGSYEVGGQMLSPAELSLAYRDLVQRFPILSIEDPFFEESMADFAGLQREISARVVGDDITVTSAKRIEACAREGAIKAVIIKPNQVGTLTETLSAMRAARENGIDCIVSHRSGETMDDFIADLAFAFGCFGLKSGALRKPERAVKYKRLEAISQL